ncbi:MAG: SUMF1/EgtB/PvdO family nonheme iron enzyme [Motiliproteus sp.]
MSRPLEIDGYTIEEDIGKGAMATVYLAVQNSLSRHVALKVMSPALMTDDTFSRRFIHEGKTVAKLQQNNIVNIWDIGTSAACCYIAMEYLSGGTLKERMQQTMYLDEALKIVRQTALALGFAHQNHVIHRDIKPHNIMFRGDGSVVLTDFGIAKDIEAASTAFTATGAAIGTPTYMSPEQAKGENLDGRSDLYCLGVVFYELLTGARPYVASDPFALALKHIHDPIPKLPPRLGFLQRTLDKIMAKDPSKRFQTAEAFIAEIDRLSDAYKTQTIRVLLSDADVSDQTEVWHQTLVSGYRAYLGNGRLGLRKTLAWGGALLALGVGGLIIVQYLDFVEMQQQQARHEQNQAIQLLLAQGERQLALSQLFQPENDNAYQTFGELLTRDPDNTKVKSAVENLLGELQQRAQQSFQQGDLPSSRGWILDGLQLDADNAPLLAIQRQVRAEEEQQRQASLLQAQQLKIQTLLARADKQILRRQLSLPAGDNALATLKEILTIVPGHLAALDGLQRIADAYALLAQTEWQRGQDDQSVQYIDLGLEVAPDHQPLLKLQEEIAARQLQRAVDSLLAEANSFIAQGQFSAPLPDNAFARYQAVLTLDPANDLAQQGLASLPGQVSAQAETSIDAGELEQGLALIAQGLSLQPDHAALLTLKQQTLKKQHIAGLLTKANGQITQQQWLTPDDDNAVTSFRELLSLAPDHPQALAGLKRIAGLLADQGKSALDQGDTTRSETVVAQGLAVDPTHPALLTLKKQLDAQQAAQGQRQHRIGELLAEAAARVQQQQFSQPSSNNAYAHYRAVLKLDPDNISASRGVAELPELIETLAADAMADRSLERSLDLVDQGLTISPEHQGLQALQQQVLTQQKILDLLTQADRQIEQRQLSAPAGNNALDTLKKLLQLAPKYPPAQERLTRIAGAYAPLASSKMKQGQLIESQALIEKGLAIMPAHPDLLEQQKALDERKSLQAAQAHQQRQIQTWLDRGKQQLRLEHFTLPEGDSALDSYRAALKLDPNHVQANTALDALPELIWAQAENELNANALTRSLALLAEGLRLNPEHAGLQALQQQALRQQQIAQLLERADKLVKEQRISQPDADNAVTSFKAVLSLQPDHPQALAGLQRIADHYATQARSRLNQGDEAESNRLIQAGLSAAPAHTALLGLQQQLTEGQQAQAARQRQIQGLLAQADRQIGRRQLTLPEDNNALSTLRQILAIDPGHTQALEGIARVADAYADLARGKIDRGLDDQGQNLIDRGLSIAPDHPPLLALQETLATRRQAQALAGEQARQQQLQALMARADRQVRLERFTRPSGDNAYESYRSMLQIDPNNAQAETALRALAETLQSKAEHARAQADYGQSLTLIAAGLQVSPSDTGLRELKKRVLAEQQTQVKTIVQTRHAQRKREAQVRDRQINQLLARAQNQLAALRLTRPPGNNAYETYQAILKIDPGSDAASRGIYSIADQLYQLALGNKQRGELGTSVDQIEQGLAIAPEHPALQTLRQQLTGLPHQDRLKDGGVGPMLVFLPKGQFQMGDSGGRGFVNEKPVHQQQIADAFYIGRYEVTFEDFDRFSDALKRQRINDQGWGRGKHPVINITWQDAQDYVAWLTQQSGRRYRLPSESEWEFAARAGTSTDYWWGNRAGDNRANCKDCGSAGGGRRTMPAGSFAANPYGLFDTAGNVYEWTRDPYTPNHLGQASPDASKRVVRGGSWFDSDRFSRAPMRVNFDPGFKSFFLGLRVVRER